MNRFTPEQRAEIVTIYMENSRSIVLTQRAYRRKYRGKQAPSDNTIRRLVSNFVEHGSLGDRPHAVHQRPRRSNELIEAVRKSVAENPHVSYRTRAQHFGVSGTTMRRILKDDLHLGICTSDLAQQLPTSQPDTFEAEPSPEREEKPKLSAKQRARTAVNRRPAKDRLKAKKEQREF